MSLRARFIVSAMLLVLAGVAPVGWYALDTIDRSISYWHDAQVVEALQKSLLSVQDRAVRKQVNDALIRYKQIGALQRPLEKRTFVLGAALTALVLLLATAVAWFLAVELTRPLRSVAGAARKIAAGDLSLSVPRSGVSEVASLVESFNDMVTGLRQSREALARAERRAAWQDIARAIAHEIKNPLTPMRLTTQRLRERFTDNRDRFEASFMRSTDMILAEIDRLERMANAFSAFAKMPVPVLAPMDAATVIAAVGDVYSEEREHGRLLLRSGDRPTPILGDAEQLKQALINLVKNGLEAAAGEAGVVELSMQAAPSVVTISVADNGPGIPEDLVGKLFQPYVTSKQSGSGVGLAIVDRIVTDHGGKVTAQNRPSGGAVFSIELPRATNGLRGAEG